MGNKQTKKINPKKINKFALGIINVQNDFFKCGTIPIKNAEEIIGPINKLRFYCYDYMDTFFSHDCHPSNHISFASTHKVKPYDIITISSIMNDQTILTFDQKLFPDHCIENTNGYDLHKDIIKLKNDTIFIKGFFLKIEIFFAFVFHFI